MSKCASPTSFKFLFKNVPRLVFREFQIVVIELELKIFRLLRFHIMSELNTFRVPASLSIKTGTLRKKNELGSKFLVQRDTVTI